MFANLISGMRTPGLPLKRLPVGSVQYNYGGGRPPTNPIAYPWNGGSGVPLMRPQGNPFLNQQQRMVPLRTLLGAGGAGYGRYPY